MVFTPIHTHMVLTWHDGSCLIPCEGHWNLEMSKRRKSEDEEWSSEKQDVGKGKRGSSCSFQGKFLTPGRELERTSLLQKESEHMSLLSASRPTALSTSCPHLPFSPGLHLSLALFLSSSSLPALCFSSPCLSPSLSPFLSFFLHFSLLPTVF